MNSLAYFFGGLASIIFGLFFTPFIWHLMPESCPWYAIPAIISALLVSFFSVMLGAGAVSMALEGQV